MPFEQAIDMMRQVFGELTVTERAGSSPRGYAVWRCRCSCGAIVEVASRKCGRGGRGRAMGRHGPSRHRRDFALGKKSDTWYPRWESARGGFRTFAATRSGDKAPKSIPDPRPRTAVLQNRSCGSDRENRTADERTAERQLRPALS